MPTADPRPDLLDAGFAFARKTADPAFRAHLLSIGWRSGMPVVPAMDTDTVGEVVRRMVINQTPWPCMIAIPDENAPCDFRLFFALKTSARWRFRRPGAIHADAEMGMVYASLQRCGEYVPEDWTGPVLFERTRAAA